MAILGSLVISTLLYILVVIVAAVGALLGEIELEDADSPLAAALSRGHRARWGAALCPSAR